MMEWGMANRLSQIIQSDRHTLIMPVDHGYFQGPTRNLEEPRKTIEPLLPYSDALFITRGVLRHSVDPDNTKPVILRVSGGATMVGKDLANEGIAAAMEEAIRLNVSAVGKELEKRDARYLALASRIAAELGARVVKTYWCEDFEKVTRGCPVPVVMAGGPRGDTELEVFDFFCDGMQNGAIGVNL